MGYELHITRADDWTESESAPITLQEWADYIARDPELVLTGAAETTTADGGVVRMEAEGLAEWNVARDQKYWFDYRVGRIVVKNPDDAIIAKMRKIARELGARVQGDDGEFYD